MAQERKIVITGISRGLGRAMVEGFAERGVLINFFVAEKQVRFEINDAAAQSSGLEFSSKLLRVARLVGTDGGR